MAQVETLKIGNTSYGITDANTLPALTAEQRSQLLLDGTYLGSAVDSGKVFETVNGTFEQFTKTAEAPATYTLTELNQSLKNTATGPSSLTVGGTAATSSYSTNIGINSRVGYASTSVGRNANASGTGGVALGASTTASGINTAAVGYNAQATAGGALMLGYGDNNEEKTFKVALTNTVTKATDESTGLFTLLKSDGTIPAQRLENTNLLATGINPSITTAAKYRSQLMLNSAVGLKNDLWYCNTITQDSINGTVTGNLLRNGTCVSGFGKSSYINTNVTLASTDTYELLLKLRLDYFVEGSASQTFISDASATYLFYFSSSRKMSGLNNGTFFNGTYVYDNTWHWLKIKWDGTTLTASYLKDASQTYRINTLPTEGWTTDITGTTNIFSGKTLCLGNKPNGPQPYAGSLDLKGCQFIKNDSVIWTGTVNNGTTEYYWRSPAYSTANPASVQIGGLVQGASDVVIGDKARTTSDNTVVIGCNAWSGSTGSTTGNTVIGYGAKATGTGSVAVGQGANSSARAVSTGTASAATQANAIAIGNDTQSTATGAIALGANARNSEAKTFKVALTDTTTAATDESTGLFTLLKADGKMPVERLGGSASSTNNKFLKEDGTWNEINAATINDDAISSVTQTWSANKIVTVFHSYDSSKQDLLTNLPGYDATATQSIKNINGVLQWVTDSTT